MIDRFGLLPEPAKTLFAITALKLRVQPCGIKKIAAGPKGGRILFDEAPKIDLMKLGLPPEAFFVAWRPGLERVTKDRFKNK